MEVRVDGAAQLRAVAKAIKATGDKGLGREMSAGLRAATRPVQTAILAEADRVLPKRGGYRDTFTASVRFRNSVRAQARQASVRLVTFGEGTSQRRDIRGLNKGDLRHPVYGRSRNTRGGRVPNPWTVTKIRAGFWDRGTNSAADAAEREMTKVLDDFASKLAGR